MKELEKVKRISIASTLFILAILIGVLTFERPKNMYVINTKDSLKALTANNYLVALKDINTPDAVFIDIRNSYEYDKGHLKNAINISTPDILSDENQALFSEFKDANKTVVLYGSNPEEANIPFLLLYQMGYDNLKLLSVTNQYAQNKLITNPIVIENAEADVKAFIDSSSIYANGNLEIRAEEKTIPKQIITIRKKKKKAAEGGC